MSTLISHTTKGMIYGLKVGFSFNTLDCKAIYSSKLSYYVREVKLLIFMFAFIPIGYILSQC